MDVERTEQGCRLTRWMENALPPPTYLKGVPIRWQGRPLAGIRIRAARQRAAMVRGAPMSGKGARGKSRSVWRAPAPLSRHHAGDREYLALSVLCRRAFLRRTIRPSSRRSSTDTYPTFIEGRRHHEQPAGAYRHGPDAGPCSASRPTNAVVQARRVFMGRLGGGTGVNAAGGGVGWIQGLARHLCRASIHSVVENPGRLL